MTSAPAIIVGGAEPRLGKNRAASALELWQNIEKAADVTRAFDAAVVS